MDQALAEVFEQARKIVTEADRRQAEEDERRREQQRDSKLQELAARIDEAFDFTSKEKLELQPRLDLLEGSAILEFVLQSLRAIAVLTPGDNGQWSLTVMEGARQPHPLGQFDGGTRQDPASRRLAAARVVTAVGNWAQKIVPGTPVAKAQPQDRWKDAPPPPPPPEQREPTYGTFGKFLGY